MPRSMRTQPEAQAQKGKPQEISSWVMTAEPDLFVCFLHLPVQVRAAVPDHRSWRSVFPALHGRIAFNMVDGGIRMAIFLGFLYMISRWKDIRRVFEYHGAEHKVVFNFESGKPVNVDNAQTFTTFHPRCGTSFLLVVMIVSTMVYTLVPFDSFAAKMASRVDSAAGDRRPELRDDPLRRQAARRPAFHPDCSRTVAAEDHDAAAV